jgi:hypothetical protein
MKMKIWDNPWNAPEVVEQIVKEAKEKGEESYRTSIEAEFVHLGGLFFGEFREDLHVVDEIKPDHISRAGSRRLDRPRQTSARESPGPPSTRTTQPSSSMSISPGNANVDEVAAYIKQRNKEWVIGDPTYVIDPSSRNQSGINADAVQAAYSSGG